ncbi:MAG: DUF3999 domain-containing protein [Mediterranea sp.]|nr:DUF3999 domain-containing protein [Mediterranea sp.]
MPVVPADGYYAIDLPKEVRGGTLPDMRDVRVRDGQGIEIAYQPRRDVVSRSGREWMPIPMEVISLPRRTELIITPDSLPISSFVLRAKNADLHQKEAVLMGSDDKRHWYGVRGRFSLDALGRSEDTETLFDLSFPLSDYHYYKLSVNDSLSSPYHFIDAGHMKAESYYRQYLLEVPPTRSIRQENAESKESEIRLIFPQHYPLCRLDFYVSAPRYYQRRLTVEADGYTNSVWLSNEGGHPQSVPLALRADTIDLSIYNGDDRPLGIDSIKAYIHKMYLVAELKKDERYTITYGDPQAEAPRYDLTFVSQLPDSLPHIAAGHIEQLPKAVVTVTPGWLVFLKKYGIWIVIVLVIAQLLNMVRRMLKA